jgi:hypothetical protein
MRIQRNNNQINRRALVNRMNSDKQLIDRRNQTQEDDNMHTSNSNSSLAEGDEKIGVMVDRPSSMMKISDVNTGAMLVPQKAEQVVPDKNWKQYTVKAGDTFDKIALRFGTGAGSDLAFLNNMDYTNPYLPKEGTVLYLPYIDDKYLDDVETKLDNLTKEAKDKGWTVAVDNLERFRKGTGGVKTMDVAWLKGFEEVKNAMKSIQKHFENAFNTLTNNMTDNQTINGDGHGKAKGNQFWWEGFIDPSYVFSRNELSYACGASTLTGIGDVILQKKDSTVFLGGVVEYEFYDRYDWHPGNDVPIGWSIVWFEKFKDSDMILLQEYRGAKEFIMQSKWSQKVTGTIEDNTLSPNNLDIKWADL